MPERHVVLVLGMHRSGTSALAGILEAAGVRLGDVRQQSPHNRAGNREHPAFQELNDAVLGFSRGAWDSVPARIHWTRDHALQRDCLIRTFDEARLWGFKDPRTLMTLDFWLPGLLHHDLHFIGTLRHPMAVVRSLRAREPEKDPARCMQLWLRYNQRLLALWSEHRFPVLDFDAGAEDYRYAALAAVQGLPELADTSVDSVGFFEPSLRHQGANEDAAKGDEGDIAASDLRAALVLHSELAAIAARG